ncbi:FAD-dependent oxidoreductase [Microbacterium sp. NPDC019599]|uniref:protoporphyrinogen/coproporphyrinogen oxidase n=1 Tax=Microbacterium sp. NPDC019599 TaxID=3154690 RepID=UPI0033E228D1
MAEAGSGGALGDLAAAAHERHIVVVGGGIAGIVTALECARVGLRVTLLEASDRLGGAVREIDVAGFTLEAAVEGWSTRGGSVRALAVDLGLESALTPAADTTTWIAGLPSGAAPLPSTTIAGIPQNPWDESVRRIIGWSGAWRAFLDRVRPPLTIGKERSLGRLVRTRMGDVVLDRLVAPVSVGLYGTHPDDVDVEAVAPGLSTALTRTGSLSGAVAELIVDRTSGPALETVEGGMLRLVDAAASRLEELGADVRLGAEVSSLERLDDGRWRVEAASDPDRSEPVDPADHVVLATPEAEARRLLAHVAPDLPAPAGAGEPVEVVTLVVRALALDGRPRGSAVYPVAGTARAVALIHSTARWPSLESRVGPGIHILRVVFGAAGAPAATAGLGDAEAARLARDEASALLGAPVGEVVGAARERFEAPRPASALGRADATDTLRSAIAAAGGLSAVGGWLAGSGLAQIVPDAVRTADAVRHDVLWGPSEG